MKNNQADKLRHAGGNSGHAPDKLRHTSDSPGHARRTARGRIGQITALLVVLFMASCSTPGRIFTEKSVTVNQRQVAVPVPGHASDWQIRARDLPRSAADTLVFADDRVRIVLTRLPSAAPLEAMPGNPLAGWNLRAEVLPDTVQVTMADTTRTERTETTIIETKTGRWAWMAIGGLLAVVIILLAARKLNM